MEWQKATIFISSTFNDMHAERDYLIKEVFPELRDWAEKHKIHLTDVDLRWGITEEESRNNGTVGTCLRHIDKSRPFFLCFIGQRRGWIPQFERDINNETKLKYPSIKQIVNGKSLTEIEIEHSLFSPLPQISNTDEIITCPPTKHNLFFFRQDNSLSHLNEAQKKIYTNETENIEKTLFDDEKLGKLKEKILRKASFEDEMNSDRPDNEKIFVRINDYYGEWNENLDLTELSHYGNSADKGRLTNFKCKNKSLKEVLIEQLKEQILLAFPQNKRIEPKSKIDENQDLFIYKNSENFIERSNYTTKLKQYVESNDNNIFLVTSEPGFGKTTLLAKFCADFKENYPQKRLFKRFCGTTSILDNYSLWKSIIDESRIDKDNKIYPNNYDELKNNMNNILDAMSRNESCVIIIDAINQINNWKDIINRISNLPDNLKLIISFTEFKKDNDLSAQIKLNDNISKESIQLNELNESEKQQLIKTYLKNYLKELDDKEIKKICKFEGSKNPLYLKILLAELRVFGSYDQLELKIKKFGNTPKSAFNHVLERLEEDEKLKGKTTIVPMIFYFLSNSHGGLSEKELVTLIKKESNLDDKYIQDTIRIFLRQVRPFMVEKDGKHDFFYESFRNAAKDRYENSIQIKDIL